MATFLHIFCFLLQNSELTYQYFAFTPAGAFILPKVKQQGIYAYIRPGSPLHHCPITPRGQEMGV